MKQLQGLFDLFNRRLQIDDVQDFDTRCDRSLQAASEIPTEMVLEGLYKSNLLDSVQRANLMSAVRARPSLRTGHKTKRCTKKDAPAEQHGTWRSVSVSSNVRILLRFTLLLKPGQRQRPLQILQRNENEWLTPEHQCTWLMLTRNGDSAEIREPHNCGNGQRWSANNWGSTSIRSRSWSLRDGAHTRWHACRFYH